MASFNAWLISLHEEAKKEGTSDDAPEDGKSAFRRHRWWTNAKAALKPFAEIANDGDDEGMHFIFKSPSVEEAATIRHFVGLAKRRVLSEAELERLRQTGFRSGGAQTSEKPSRTMWRLPTCPPTPPKGNFDDAAFRLGRVPLTSSAYGEKKQSIPPLDIEFIRECFAVRQDGTLVRRECHVAALAHEPATFRGPGNRLMVRVYVNGAIRRVLASRIAWCLSCGEWPKGIVRARNRRRSAASSNSRPRRSRCRAPAARSEAQAADTPRRHRRRSH